MNLSCMRWAIRRLGWSGRRDRVPTAIETPSPNFGSAKTLRRRSSLQTLPVISCRLFLASGPRGAAKGRSHGTGNNRGGGAGASLRGGLAGVPAASCRNCQWMLTSACRSSSWRPWVWRAVRSGLDALYHTRPLELAVKGFSKNGQLSPSTAATMATATATASNEGPIVV
jgi:hypothetical protein